MIAVLTDIVQSLSICMLAITLIFLSRRVNRLPRQTAPQHFTFDYKEPEAVCGCTHHQCFHDENGCGHKLGSSMVIACGCKRYTGPEPLPQVIP